MTRTLGHDDDGIALRTRHPADRIALRGVRLLGRLSGMSLRATVEQTFVNLEPRPIEAVYTFPLPEQAAVCGFEVVTADRTLAGTVEESEQAEERYERAVSGGHGAYLMEQHRPDVFSVRVGNLKPRQAATIRLTYVMPLERVDKQVRVAFPTTIAPRYATAAAADPIDAAIEGDALNPPHVLSVPYGLSLRLEVDLGRELVGCFSPSHPIDVSHDEAGRAIVTMAGGSLAEMNRDVVLTLRLAKEAEPRVQAEPGPDEATYLAVTFVPEFDEAELGDPAPAETVFVLDCSGSMTGESIAQAKAALELCLRSLSPGDTFNVCRFGSTFELLASEPLPYTQQTLDRALTYVRQSRDLGGTELHAPLEKVLSTPRRAGTVRQVILLTDGQVTNEPAVVELCRKHRTANRVFTFGIGSSASAFPVRGIARATGGAAEFITAGERIDEKVLRTFARLASPTVHDVSLDWGEAEVQTLAEIPPVFDGDVLAVFARCAGRPPAQVTLSCRVGGGTRSWRVEVPPGMVGGAGSHDGVIPTMWARRTIQSLEEVAGPGLVRARKRKPTREQETLVRLSKQFNLLCSLTTFIAVEHRSAAERTDGEPETRRVPVMLAAGWGGVECLDMMMAGPAGGAAAAAARKAKRSRGVIGRLLNRAGGTIARFDVPPAAAASPPSEDTDFDFALDCSIRSLDRTVDKSMDRSLDKSIDSTASEDPAEAALARLLDSLISEARRTAADEVHIEPMADRVQIRFRIHGQLEHRDRFARKLRKPFEAYLRRRAGIDSSAAAGGAGTFHVQVDSVPIGVSVSSVPTTHGDAYVLRLRSGMDEVTASVTADVSNYEPVIGLLGLQRAEGSFGWTERVAEMVYVHGRGWKAAVEASLPPTTDPAARQDAVHTVLVLLLLATRFPSQSALWQRAASKAVRVYLAKAFGTTPPGAEAWFDGLRQQLAPASQ